MDKIDAFAQSIQSLHPQVELRYREVMAPHTTFRIGGAVALMALPADLNQLISCRKLASQMNIPVEILGRGSNLLVADEGADILVISTAKLDGVTQTAPHEMTAGAGILLAKLANFAAQQNLGGLVFAHGIPGSLGGAVTMNGGAYGGEMKDVVKSVRCVNAQGEILELSAEEAKFEYRHSIFCDKDLIIAEVVLNLPEGDCQDLQQQMAILSAKRRNSQPLEYPSGGSMFKRPVGHYAAALIDQCGLKGFAVGGAQVSEKHAGFVINRGGATCADVLALVEGVKARVFEETGVTLEMEVKVIK